MPTPSGPTASFDSALRAALVAAAGGKAAPDVGLTTDIIVAFPGETDRDFEDTMELVRKVFSMI